MSKLLNTLNLSATRKPSQVSTVIHRRNKLSGKIAEQIALATATQSGTTYAPVRLRSIRDARTGLRTQVETHKRIKQWWFTAEDGTLAVSVRYGSRTLELAKGKWAVAVADIAELITVLTTLQDAVNAGELDDQINAAAQSLRTGFRA
jgi:hypothetical protein